MKAPAFWWRARRTAAARLLSPIGAVVGAVAARRMAREPAVRLGIPVICVGNPTVGGAGKTPVALAIAALLAQHGRRPVFLTRGYRGRLAGPVVVGPQHTAADVGDEPLLLADCAPTVVSRERGAGGTLAATLGDVVVMDDGFQNPALGKDLSILVLDAAVGIGNGLVTPAGPMRAPLAAHLPHAGALALVESVDEAQTPLPPLSLPVHLVRLVQTPRTPLCGVRVLAFAGIGRPEKFFAGLAAQGAEIVARRSFGDHAEYGEEAARALLREAEAKQLMLLTTTKDMKRLAAGGEEARRLAARAEAVPVRAELPEALSRAILECVAPR